MNNQSKNFWRLVPTSGRISKVSSTPFWWTHRGVSFHMIPMMSRCLMVTWITFVHGSKTCWLKMQTKALLESGYQIAFPLCTDGSNHWRRLVLWLTTLWLSTTLGIGRTHDVIIRKTFRVLLCWTMSGSWQGKKKFKSQSPLTIGVCSFVIVVVVVVLLFCFFFYYYYYFYYFYYYYLIIYLFLFHPHRWEHQ